MYGRYGDDGGLQAVPRLRERFQTRQINKLQSTTTVADPILMTVVTTHCVSVAMVIVRGGRCHRSGQEAGRLTLLTNLRTAAQRKESSMDGMV